jgi:tetratricopeptide (TPR) repeat protein
VELLVTVGLRLRQLNIEHTEYLKRVQAAHPSDYWANRWLASDLVLQDAREAIPFYRAAIVARPDDVISYNDLGWALKSIGRLDESIAMLHRATQVDPSYAPAFSNLGVAYKAKGDIRSGDRTVHKGHCRGRQLCARVCQHGKRAAQEARLPGGAGAV